MRDCHLACPPGPSLSPGGRTGFGAGMSGLGVVGVPAAAPSGRSGRGTDENAGGRGDASGSSLFSGKGR